MEYYCDYCEEALFYPDFIDEDPVCPECGAYVEEVLDDE